MRTCRFREFSVVVACILSTCLAVEADTPAITQVDWDTRTATCPATVTQATTVTIRVTNVNDLLIDFASGEAAYYELRTKSSAVSVVPPENPFLQIGQTCPQDPQLLNDLANVRTIRNPLITPPVGSAYIPLAQTLNAAQSEDAVRVVESEYNNSTCAPFFTEHSNDAVVQWIKRLVATTTGSSAAPAHSVDFTVNLQPNENYQFTIREFWKDKVVKDASLTWNCGETDVLTLSAGPIITTLPYRTYNQQEVPSGSGTQNELVVSGTNNVNVLAAALLNYHFPAIPHFPTWSGFAISIGPVYTLGNAPSVSRLGLFVGGSIHMYRSIFITPGIHIGEFADFPAGFHAGSPIPPNFGMLTPVTRNTARFAIGITFKTTTFKKSSQGAPSAAAGGGGSGNGSGSGKKTQTVTGSQGSGGSGGTRSPGANPQQTPGTQGQGGAAPPRQ